MAQLHITELKCIRKQDVVGKDEPVIWIAGQYAWDGKIEKGELVDADLNLRKEFTDSVLVELKEANGAGQRDGKLLRAWTIQATPAGPRDPLRATAAGYDYQVFYHVD
jgi:hypothetical protein